MDWQALTLSLSLAGATLACLLVPGLWLGRWLARTTSRSKPVIEALVMLPLVLPPTVLGYYLLSAFSLGGPWGFSLTFNFTGLVLASVVFNVPFMVQPVQRAFESIPAQLHEAAAVCGLGAWQAFWRVELPLAWPGLVSALVLSFVHTLGEFGVVLMVGGNIPGETRTLAVSIYDRVQAFDLAGAHQMSATLLLLSLVAVAVSFIATARLVVRR